MNTQRGSQTQTDIQI